MTYYKITKAQADTIGYFKYTSCEAFDPFCGEQKDGTYLVGEDVYEMLKNRTEFTKVNFSKLSKIEQSKFDTKPTGT